MLADRSAKHYALVGPQGTYTIASALPGQGMRLLDAAKNDAGFKPHADGLREKTGMKPPLPATRPAPPAGGARRP